MKATPVFPIASFQGTIHRGYYARILHGKQVIQRCPKRTKPPTPAQVRARQIFAEKYACKRPKPP